MIVGISHNANVGAGNEINMQLTALQAFCRIYCNGVVKQFELRVVLARYLCVSVYFPCTAIGQDFPST